MFLSLTLPKKVIREKTFFEKNSKICALILNQKAVESICYSEIKALNLRPGKNYKELTHHRLNTNFKKLSLASEMRDLQKETNVYNIFLFYFMHN